MRFRISSYRRERYQPLGRLAPRTWSAPRLSDLIGRRRTFFVMAGSSILTVLVYTLLPLSQLLVLIGVPLGFFTSGIVAGIGAWFAELFPIRIRGSGQGFSYNFGRAFGSVVPSFVGFAAAEVQLGTAMAIFAAGSYALVVIPRSSCPKPMASRCRTEPAGRAARNF
jgi:MFS family permease